MSPRLISIVALITTVLFAQPTPRPCLEYEPAVVHLSGRIARQTFPGPPNFESIKEGDAKEIQWILHLSTPICVNGKQGDELNSEPESGLRTIQLVIVTSGDFKRYSPLLGKDVIVTGTLFHAITMHHRTHVLIEVQSIQHQPPRAPQKH